MQLFRNRRCIFVISFFGALVVAAVAGAAVLVNQPGPYSQHAFGDVTTDHNLYFAGNKFGLAADVASGTSAIPYNGTDQAGKGFRVINTSDGTQLLWIDVQSDDKALVAANMQAVVSISNDQGVISLTGAETNPSGTGAPVACGLTCQGAVAGGSTITNAFANYSPGTILRVSFSLDDLCTSSSINSNSTFCNSNAYTTLLHGTDELSINVNFSMIPAVTAAASPTPAPTETDSFTIQISDLQPTISCPSSGNIEDYYFPGDKQIYIDPGKYGISGNSGFDVQSLILLAFENSVTAPVILNDGVPNGTTGGYILASSGRQSVGPFDNSSSVTDSAHTYNGNVYVQNKAGILSDPTLPCHVSPIQAQPISGLLTESKCFIATAAFHDGRAAPVMMLRRFRDQILTQFSLGRSFIENYYAYSPALAEWAWDKPVIRSFALRALAPVELMAWAILKFSEADEVSSQPYIDRIKKEMADDEKEKGTPLETESHIDSIKKKMDATSPALEQDSYSERIKKKLKEEDEAAGYAEREKNKLPPENAADSPIEMVKQKRDKYPLPQKPNIDTALGFKFGASPGMKVTNTKNPKPTATFGNIYGAGWQPDLVLHGEKQFYHSENFGSVSLGFNFGLSYAEGFGQLAFAFGSKSTTQSETKFSFLQVPLILDAYYRMNLFRIIRPYVGVGAGSMLYTEIRNDSNPDKRGYSFIYTTSAGASILLDFIDPSTSRDSYLGNGIQHSYLTVEYNYMNTFAKTGVLFQRSGIYAGFLFEY